jgi:uncharacterized protein (TIGR03437 family)
VDLDGVQVRVNGQAVPVLYSSPTQVAILCPALDVDTLLSVAVETAGGLTAPLTAKMNEASPKILSVESSGQNQGPLSFVGTHDQVKQRDFSQSGHPAQPGDEILILATGLGEAGRSPAASLLVKIGDAYATAESVQPVAGQAGLLAIQLRVPASTAFGRAVPVQLQVLTSDGRQVTSNVVAAAIEPVRP